MDGLAACEDAGCRQVDLAVTLAGLQFKNPLTTASGTFAPGQKYAELWTEQGVAKSGAAFASLGAVTTKGVSPVAWPGNTGIRIDESASGMLNSIGLENPGVEAFCADDLLWLAAQGAPIIVNVCGHTVAEYVAVIERLEQEQTVSAYELNISCPNIDNSGMAFGIDPVAAAKLTKACRAVTSRPMIVKLTPNVTDITEVARAVEAAGADALSLINTLAGMTIDLNRRKPVFDRVVAGLSGPAIKPVALWAVYRVYQAVRIPLIGMGGVRSVTDVVEFMLAGATVVGIGSYSFTDPLVIPRIARQLADWCAENGVEQVSSLIGALHAA
ncbi:MAG: dihydroorotate dehydrogenase [Coriobacteriia bacterium]|nr:dihydroorotate dehydrogenase [Coriobacteriia bacterium]